MGAHVSTLEKEQEYNFPHDYPVGVKYALMSPLLKEFDEKWFDPRRKPKPGEDFMNGGHLAWFEHLRTSGAKTFTQNYYDLYMSDPNIKAIYDKYNISPEHPGMDFHQFGLYSERDEYNPGNIHILNSRWGFFRRFGPRYYDHPEGESCHEKTIAGAKGGVWIGTFWWLLARLNDGPKREWNKFSDVIRDVKLMPKYWVFPVGALATGAYVACMSCAIRRANDWRIVSDKDPTCDDWINYALGGASVGIVRLAQTGAGWASFKWALHACVFAGLMKAYFQTEDGLRHRWGTEQSWFIADWGTSKLPNWVWWGHSENPLHQAF